MSASMRTRVDQPPSCSSVVSSRSATTTSSGSFVLGRMTPWKRSGAPSMTASRSPRKKRERTLFGRMTTTLSPKSTVLSASTITSRDLGPLNS
jgi:hypothetical protein